MTETLLNQIDKLNEYLHLESDINKKDFKYIDAMLQSMRSEAINYSRCCKSDSEQLPNMTLEQAIAKAKPNLDKITDVDKHIEDIR